MESVRAEIVHDWVNYNVSVLAISAQSEECNLKGIPSIMLKLH